MKQSTEEIINQLQAIVEDEVFSLVADAPYEVIAWKVQEKGEFSVESFLLHNQGLIPWQPTAFLNHIYQNQPESTWKTYEDFISFLESNLSELIIYTYRLLELPNHLLADFPVKADWFGDLGIPIIIGLTLTGEWIGLGMRQENKYVHSSSRLSIKELNFASESTKKLLNQIQTIITDINNEFLVSSKLDVSNYFAAAVALNREHIVENTLINNNFLNYSNIDEFLQGQIVAQEQEISEMEGKIAKLEADLSKKNNSEEIQRIKGGVEAIKTQGGLGLKSFFDAQVNSDRVYNFEFLRGGEYSTIHLLLGKIGTEDMIGVATYSFTI